MKKLLLINPWIYDFTAYDLWSKPLGLLYMASFLRSFDYRVELIDCLDKYCPGAADRIKVKKQATFQDPDCKCKFCVGFSIAQSALKKAKE